MKKTLKWSVLVTILIAILWLVIPGGLSKMSHTIIIHLNGFNLSINDSILRLWDITVIVPSLLLITLLLKKDSDFNPGTIICSIFTLIITGTCFDNNLIKISIFLFGVFGFFVYFMNLVENAPSGEKKYVTVIKRSFASILIVLLVNTLAFGLLNGVLIVLIFVGIYMVFGVVTILSIILWKVGKALPKNIKFFFKWMNT